jgi:hypothetical protein
LTEKKDSNLEIDEGPSFLENLEMFLDKSIEYFEELID